MIRRCLSLDPHHREAINLMQSIGNSNDISSGADALLFNSNKKEAEATATSHYNPLMGRGETAGGGASNQRHPPPPAYRLQQLQEQESAGANNYSSRRWNKTF